MLAVVKSGARVSAARVPRPVVEQDDDVVIRVTDAGICRTDLYVAEGTIPSRGRVILGHEFSGVIAGAGDAANVMAGDRAAVMPWLACEGCPECGPDLGESCRRATMLGVDHDGAFAEFIKVPARAVHRAPTGAASRALAYAEPVAAALGVLKAGIRPGQRGVIWGRTRFSALTARILAARGFSDVSLEDESMRATGGNLYDFAIETCADSRALARLVAAVRPGGTIVLKSRPHAAVAIDLHAAVRKELTFRSVLYGRFSEALEMIVSGAIDLSDLVGPTFSLDRFEDAFAAARRDESTKVFFSMEDSHVRNH